MSNPRPIAIYARVSTDDQNVEAQLHALREYAERRGVACLEFVDDGVSGRKESRPALDAMLAAARRHEVSAVVVIRLDRLARSLLHMAKLGADLAALEVDLVSLNEGIDTTTPTGRAMFGMCGVFAQLEADLIRERTIAGVAAARRAGKTLGRPTVMTEEMVKRAARLRRVRKDGKRKTFRQIAEILDVADGTVRRALKETM